MLTVRGQSFFGFLTLAWREPWAAQMLIDLVIACGLSLSWMVPDARRRGLRAWPWVLTTIVLGSMGLLGYLVRRGFHRPTASARS